MLIYCWENVMYVFVLAHSATNEITINDCVPVVTLTVCKQ